MSGKLKLLLGLLALGALTSAYYTFSAFRGTGNPDGRTANTLNAISDTCSRDTDKDGLNDCDETYWNTDYKNPDTDGDGFLDGEEVLSGHDPAKKGPDDFLDRRGNVTQQAATLTLGAATVGDLDPNSPNYKDSVDALSNAVMDRYAANSAVPDEDVMVGGDRHADIIKYGYTVSTVLLRAFPDLTSGFVSVLKSIGDIQLADLPSLYKTDPERFKQFTGEIDHQTMSIDSSLATLRAMSVPPSMITGQKNILMLLKGTRQQYQMLRQISQDPMQGGFAFQSLSKLTRLTVIEVSDDFGIRLNTALQKP